METWFIIILVVLIAVLIMNKDQLRIMFNSRSVRGGGCNCDRSMDYGMRGGGSYYF
jgi:hypothetical protein